MTGKPTLAFVFSLSGAVFIVLHGFAMFSLYGGVYGTLLGMIDCMTVDLLSMLIGCLIFIGTIMINSENKSSITMGSIVVLVLAIVSFLFAGGFFIGPILCIAGSILGLKWTSLPPPPPPIPPPIIPISTPTTPMFKHEEDLTKLKEEKEVEEMTRWLETAIRKVEKLIEEIEKS